jgi:dTDP-glucose 4,6-dehydratase
MRILVTGGKGVVGTALVEELRRRGHHVIACDLSHDCDQIGITVATDVPDAGYLRCDVGEYRQLERLFNQWGPFDYVYHTAAEFGRWNGEDYYENLWKTNVIGAKHVLRLQEQLRFRLIHFSSSEVYGDWPELMIESVMDDYEIKQMNDYAMTKWVNEMQIRNSIQSRGTETVVVRLFNTYGPGEYYSPYRSVNCRFVYCALRGFPWTVFRGHARTSTYLADTVRTLSRIVDHFKPGETYNIAGRNMHTVEELSDTVLKVTGADPGLVRYRDAEILTTRVKNVNAEKAVRDLGHHDTCTLEEGIRRTAEWMRKVYQIP